MFELIIVGIMFAGLVGLGCFGMAFIAAELYKDYEEVRGLLHDEIED